jgi:dolichol kinase
MKKILFLLTPIFTALAANAQGYDPDKHKIIPDKFIEIPILLLGIYLAATFILRIIKMILDNRLKYKLLEKGVSADVIKEFLQPAAKDTKNEVLKWTTLFVGLCVGLIVSYFFQPYGNHTVAIIAFSIAISFLVFYNFIYRSPKP